MIMRYPEYRIIYKSVNIMVLTRQKRGKYVRKNNGGKR